MAVHNVCTVHTLNIWCAQALYIYTVHTLNIWCAQALYIHTVHTLNIWCAHALYIHTLHIQCIHTLYFYTSHTHNTPTLYTSILHKLYIVSKDFYTYAPLQKLYSTHWLAPSWDAWSGRRVNCGCLPGSQDVIEVVWGHRAIPTSGHIWGQSHTTLLLALPAVEIWQIMKLHVDCADMKG